MEGDSPARGSGRPGEGLRPSPRITAPAPHLQTQHLEMDLHLNTLCSSTETGDRDIKRSQLPLSAFISRRVMKAGDERLWDFITLNFRFVISHLLHQVPWDQFALGGMEMDLPGGAALNYTLPAPVGPRLAPTAAQQLAADAAEPPELCYGAAGPTRCTSRAKPSRTAPNQPYKYRYRYIYMCMP